MKILLPVVQSDYTERNLDRVCDLVKKLDAELTLLHIVAMSTAIAAEAYVDPKPFVGAGEKFLNETKGKVEKMGVKVSAHLELAYGNPAHTIVEYAKKGGFDLIALGARGQSKIRNLLLGSVADTVARNASCSVLIVR